jgi:hypothetical protein
MVSEQVTELDEYKARRGWWFAVFFLLLVVGLVVFLARVTIVDQNRDVLVGILVVITVSRWLPSQSSDSSDSDSES